MDAHRLFARAVAAVMVGVALGVAPSPAHALAQRTFVASNGNDANACSLTAPCRGLARAITQTADKGEIIVLDSAGYGAVTIDKSVSIIAPPGVYAGISVFTGNGVTIATPGVKVLLRGLTINGQGGSVGIDFSAGSGAELVVEQCTVANMTAAGVSASSGLGRIVVRDSLVHRNGGDGIAISQATRATIDRTRVERNTGAGIKFSDGTWGAVTEATIDGNGSHGVYANSAAGVLLQVTIDRAFVGDNSGGGILATTSPPHGQVRMAVARSTIARNSVDGVAIGGVAPGTASGDVSDNVITGNAGNGLFVGDGAVVSATGSRITWNNYGFDSTDGILYSLGDNFIAFNFRGNLGSIYAQLGK